MYKKIIISFLFTIILLIILGVTSIFEMQKLASMSQKLYKHPYTVTNATKTIETNLISMHTYMKDVALSTSDKELQLAIERVNRSEIIVYKQFDIIFDRYLGDKEDIQKSYDAFVKWKPIRDEVILLMLDNQKEKASKITKEKGAKHVEYLNLQVNKMIKYAQKKAIFFNKNAIDTKEESIALIVIILIIIISVTIFILFLLIKNISQTDKEIKKHFHIIDQNIMSATLDRDFNITQISNALVRHLKFDKDMLLKRRDNFLYSDCQDSKKEEIIRVAKSGKRWHGEIKKLDRDNQIKWLCSNIQPIFDDNYLVVGYTNIFQDISSQKIVEELSNVDALTSLYNRRFFDNIFAKEIKVANRTKTLLVFVMMDIDHFKQYNDTYGHQAGDRTLAKVAQVIKKSIVREDDYTFRLGGEEFGMLYRVKSQKEAIDIAKETKEDIESLEIPHSGNSASKFVTISMGLYLMTPNNSHDGDTIYNATDELLYQAKANGRNKIVTSFE